MAQPAGLLFSKDHEWVKLDGDVATIGISDYAQSSLGDIVYVELPRVGATLTQFASIGVVESVKAVSDIYTPLGGEIVEINAGIDADPVARQPRTVRRRLVLQDQTGRRGGEEQPDVRRGLRQAYRRGVMYTPHTARDIEEMLRVVGVASLDDLVRVPDAVALKTPVDLVPALSEIEIAARFAAFARAHRRR